MLGWLKCLITCIKYRTAIRAVQVAEEPVEQQSFFIKHALSIVS